MTFTRKQLANTHAEHGGGFVTRPILLDFVEQIEAVFAAIDDLGEDKKAIYGAAHDAGIEKTALGKVVAYRRQRGKNPEKFDEQDALVQKYLGMLDGTVGDLEPHARIRARDVAEQMRTRTEFFAQIDRERAEGNRKGDTSVVYFLHAAEAGVIKIGVTNDLDRRIGSIARMSPLALDLVLTIPGDHKTEAFYHERFKSKRLHGEWFSATDDTILGFVRGYDADGAVTKAEGIDTKAPAHKASTAVSAAEEIIEPQAAMPAQTVPAAMLVPREVVTSAGGDDDPGLVPEDFGAVSAVTHGNNRSTKRTHGPTKSTAARKDVRQPAAGYELRVGSASGNPRSAREGLGQYIPDSGYQAPPVDTHSV